MQEFGTTKLNLPDFDVGSTWTANLAKCQTRHVSPHLEGFMEYLPLLILFPVIEVKNNSQENKKVPNKETPLLAIYMLFSKFLSVYFHLYLTIIHRSGG